jgi:hypothetical protein
LVLGSALAQQTVWQVPRDFTTIKAALDNSNVQDGETVSVWGTDSFIYRDPLDFHGKGIYLVNRVYIDPSLQHDSIAKWAYDTIDVTDSNRPAVTFNVAGAAPSYTPVIKGFTIRGGSNHNVGAGSGGGIRDSGWAMDIIKNRIVRNFASGMGGGVFMYDSSAYSGSSNSLDSSLLLYNEVDSNTCESYGAGISILRSFCPVGLSESTQGLIYLRGNHVLDNQAESGGVYLQTDSEVSWAPSHCPINFGDSASPGYNVVMRNVSINNGDIEALIVKALNVGTKDTWAWLACGNYWGTVDYDSLGSLINQSQAIHRVLLSPVAASSRWFDIVRPSICYYDMLVTGDLRIDTSLYVGFDVPSGFDSCLYVTFSDSPDDTLSGGNSGLCDLIVSGQGILDAEGAYYGSPVVFRSQGGHPERLGVKSLLLMYCCL